MRNATKDHIGLCHIIAAHIHFLVSEISLALSQSERTEFYLASQSVVKATFVINKVVFHPRSGRTANNQQNIVAL